MTTCESIYPPSRGQTCVRVPGHEGRHVWISDDSPESPAYDVVAWRNHHPGCTCVYCVPAGAGG